MAKREFRWTTPDQWAEWCEWLSVGLHGRNRWRLPVLLFGILFANGRRTVTSWLRATGVSTDFDDYYYFLTCVGRKSKTIATQLVALLLRTLPLPGRVLLVIDDSPTRGVGCGPTASTQHLDQPCRVQLESLDAYTGRTLGVGQEPQGTLQS